MFDLYDDLEGVRLANAKEYKQVLLLSLHIIYSKKTSVKYLWLDFQYILKLILF